MIFIFLPIKMKLLFFVFLHVVMVQYTEVAKRAYCDRSITYQSSDNGYTATMNAISACNNVPTSVTSATGTSSWIYSYLKTTPVGSTAPYEFYITLLGTQEYRDVNKVPGYQIGSDVIQYQIQAYKNGRGGLALFSPVNYNKQVLSNGTTVHILSYNLKKTSVDIAEINVNLTYATREVSVVQEGAYNSKIIITPNSFKWSFNLKNITYRYANSAGIALMFDTVSTTPGSVFPASTSSIGSTIADFRPNDVNQYQNVYLVPNTPNADFNRTGNWFSCNTRSNAKKGNITVNTPVIYSQAYYGDYNYYNNMDPNVYSVSTMWLSTFDRVDEVTMEMNIMSMENSSNKYYISIYIILLILINN